MAYDVKVHIDLAKPIGSVGFGMPLILVENASKEVAYKVCASVADVKDAGFDQDTLVKISNAATLLFMQDKAPKQIAVAAVTGAATEALSDKTLLAGDWRQLIVVRGAGGDDDTSIKAISDIIETMDGKMYFTSTNEYFDAPETVTGLDRTVILQSWTNPDVLYPEAALVGATAGRAAGSFTYKNMKLKGVGGAEMTGTELDAVHALGQICVCKKAGDVVTSEGKVAGGEYIDIIDSKDYIIQQIEYRIQKMLNNADKIPYDNIGIAMLESVVKDVLQGAFNNGMIATKADGSPDYTVNFALREDTTAEDRLARKYFGGSFRFALAGAIHHVEINGEITV